MTTGCPDASLVATCANDPIDRAPRFGGRHGTRLKMSPADFATCWTFSISLVARLFGCAGSACSAAAGRRLPVPVVCGSVACLFRPSDLAPSDSVACWVDSARAAGIEPGNDSTSDAAASSDDITKKGRWKRINARSSILLRRVDVSCIDHECRQRTTKAVVNTLRQLRAVRGAEKIEIS